VAIFSPADARRAVERGLDDSVRFLADLVRVPSLLGEEEPAQQRVEERLRDLGFAVESVVPDPKRLAERSDDVCTALQLTNFWQDLGRDWQNGRLYVPRADRARAGAREEDLTAPRLTAAWKQVMADMVQRTRALFASGRPVCDGLDGRLRWELRLTWLGGSRILDRIESAGYEVVHHRPKLTAADAPVIVWQAVMWRRD